MNLLESETLHRFTAADYLELECADRTELLGGVLFDVSPRHEPHRFAVSTLNELLVRGLPSALVVRTQEAVAISGWLGRDAPEVDVAILKRKKFRPGPTASDAVAFIEVSDSTYALDRSYKVALYVGAGVPSWIVNVQRRQVEFYGSSDDLGREHGTVFGVGETVDVLGVRIAVGTLFDDGVETESA